MRIPILGIPIDRVDRQEALDIIDRFAKDGGCHHIVTANPEILDRASDDEALADLLRRADLITADGNGILLAARLLGTAFPERVTGVELAEDLCRESGARKLSLYFLGGKPGIARDAAVRMRRLYPDVNIAGYWHGYFRTHEDNVLQDIRNAKPDILLVGLGAPLQDEFIAHHQCELNIPVAMGVGGSFDVLSGHVKRAPKLFQNLRLEWAYRIATDPARWLRALALPRFVWKVLKSRQSH